MRALFGAALTGGAALILVALWRRRSSVIKSFGGLSYFVSVMILAVGSNAAVVFLPERYRLPGLVAVAAVFCMTTCLTAQLDDVPGGADRLQRGAWWAYGALLLWLFLADATVNGGIYSANRWMAYAIAFVVWLAVGVLAGRQALRPQAVAYTGSIVLALMTLPSVIENSFWTECTTGTFTKCSPAGALYKSYASSENFIAIIASFTLIAALTTVDGRLRAAICGQAALVVVATGSRTGLASLGIAVVVGSLALRMDARRPGGLRMSSSLCLAGIGSMVALGATLVFKAAEETLSHRGAIWIAVRRPVSEHPVTGVGISKWEYYQEFGESPQHFFHSGYALALFGGGFVGLVLFGAWLFLMLRSANRPGLAPLMLAGSALLAIYSLTEVVWNPLAIDGLTWIVAVMSCIAVVQVGATSTCAHEASRAGLPRQNGSGSKRPKRVVVPARSR